MLSAVRAHAAFAVPIFTIAILTPAMAQVSVTPGGPMPQIAPMPTNVDPMPMQTFKGPAVNVGSSGINVGAHPSATQCANLLRRALLIPSLKQLPDYEYCFLSAK